VYVLADDLGWGDLGCYNPESDVPTPYADRLASRGVRFTDMHSPSSVCTPTRYGVLTGRYCWRTHLKEGVLWGYSPNLIEPGRTTAASLLKSAGYHTAAVGKWHLGLGDSEKTDYSKPLRPGPLDHGFDYFFGIPASLDMDPYVYVENDRVAEAPSGYTTGLKSPRGVFWRPGPIAPGFVIDEVLPTLADKATGYIKQRAAERDKSSSSISR
jgi:arylsulfatase A-like enzyme